MTVGQFCNFLLPAKVSYSSWNRYTLRFISDSVQEGSGFEAYYVAKGNELSLESGNNTGKYIYIYIIMLLLFFK